MYLVSYLPVAAHFNGVNISQVIEFDSRDPTRYVKDLQRVTLEILAQTKVATDVDRKRCIDSIRDSILRVNEFWMEKVFRPILKEYPSLEEDSACHCIRGYCRFDLFRCSHYEPFGAKVKVDIFARAPSISINCATQNLDDVAKLKDYYIYTMKRFEAMPCCSCLPISKKLLSILENLIMLTKFTLYKLGESFEDVKKHTV